MNELINLIYPIVAAVFLASYLYVKQTTGSSPEAFDLVKFSSTVIVGGGIAVFFYLTGSPISSEVIGVQLVTYAGLIVIVENGLKIFIRSAVTVNISALTPFLPAATPAAVVPAVASAVPVAAAVAPVAAAAVPARVGATVDPAPSTSSNEGSAYKIAVKFYPAIVQGVSPLSVTVHAVADPAEGIHEVTRGIIDWKDGSPVETFTLSHGIARLNHVYNFVQRENFEDNAPCKHYAHEFYPEMSVVSRDGLTTEINNVKGRSLIITCKDAEAVALGKVTNFPAPQ